MTVNCPDKSVPPHLMHGDTIGIIAPASPFDLTRFNNGIQVLASMGFKINIPDSVYNKSGYLAGSDRDRADQINASFADESIQAILCARGGYGSMRVLPYLDYTSIRQHPKLIMGFSDITALLLSLYTRSGLISFHGPVITTLATAGSKTLSSVYTALTADKMTSIRLENGITLNSGRASGRIVCGNLTTLCHLVGTPFQPMFNGNILIVEDTGEKPYRIDRMLTQMNFAGVFEGLCGLGIGRFSHCGDMDELHEISRFYPDSISGMMLKTVPFPSALKPSWMLISRLYSLVDWHKGAWI